MSALTVQKVYENDYLSSRFGIAETKLPTIADIDLLYPYDVVRYPVAYQVNEVEDSSTSYRHLDIWGKAVDEYKAASRPAVVIDLASRRLVKETIRHWVSRLSNADSIVYDQGGDLTIEARANLEIEFLERGDKILEPLIKHFSGFRVPVRGLYAICDAFGRFETVEARRYAAFFLTGLLKHAWPEGRDAATLGIGLLNDPTCLPALQIAYEEEKSIFLKETMLEILEGV